jgi:nucleotide-binding universal stress UspA family protein
MHVAAGKDIPLTLDNYMASAEPLEALHSLMQPGLRLKVPPRYLVEFGSPGTHIPEAARTLQASVIVIGAHGAGKFASILSHLPGRTAYQVAAHAGCPVLSVRAT